MRATPNGAGQAGVSQTRQVANGPRAFSSQRNTSSRFWIGPQHMGILSVLCVSAPFLPV